MIGYPYTKLMNSNNNVEQSAGLILCSVEAARSMGVPTDRWIFPHSGTGAHDHWYISNRADLHSSPAIRLAGARALELAGTAADELAHVDLYSCFPSAVQIASAELGLDPERQLTVTGGMSFAGGPWNNYPMHGIATMAGILRDDPDVLGLCTANGGYTTKHAFGVYGARPPAAGFRHDDLQAEVDAAAPPRRGRRPHGRGHGRQLHGHARPPGRSGERAGGRAHPRRCPRVGLVDRCRHHDRSAHHISRRAGRPARPRRDRRAVGLNSSHHLAAKERT